jgi:hypothetical protein
MSTTKRPSSVACIRFVRFWHRAWALYHKIELHAACRRGDMSDALTHAGRELHHIAKTPLIHKPNIEDHSQIVRFVSSFIADTLTGVSRVFVFISVF